MDNDSSRSSLVRPSMLSPLGEGEDGHACGYCKSETSSRSYGAWAYRLRHADYMAMMDRGWRRSGAYLYKPNMTHTCCPQYAIRLPLAAFTPSKQHRALINKSRRYLDGEWGPGAVDSSTASKHQPKKKKPAENTRFDLRAAITDLLTVSADGKQDHVLTTTLEPASSTPEKFALYDRYQQAIHGDAPAKNTPKSFGRFLVDSPLSNGPCDPAICDRSGSVVAGQSPSSPRQRGSSSMPRYGSFHLQYRLDGKLVGVSVIDIAPQCVSSVYFFYDPDVQFLGLGKLSALVEMVLAMDEGVPHLYLGYFIPECVKMEYKAQFHGSQLLDPVAYTWVGLDDRLRERLHAADAGFTTFADLVETGSTATCGRTRAQVPDDGMFRQVSATEADSLLIHVEGSVMPFGVLADALGEDGAEYAASVRSDVVECAKRLDEQTCQEMVFVPND
ncbi:arginine-tRNA-protein transferase [Blastocladiella britannica]|nr:arginine-tRNA-protein transferase [Blastocladiella britannica]